MATAVKRFKDAQRVLVLRNGAGTEINAPGVVVRRRMTDDGAWVELASRHSDESVHPFPADDSRATQVLAYPEDCEKYK